MEKIRRFFKEEDGVTAIEYGLIAAGIGVAIAATVLLVGTQLNTFFGTVSSCLTTAS